MAIKSKAHSDAVTRYISNHYDQFSVRMEKGKREEYASAINALGYDSMNQFIIDAMDEKIKRDLNNEQREI